MKDFVIFLLVIGGIFLVLAILRLFGAWLLRIDEVIAVLKDIRKELQGRDKEE